MLLFTMKTLHSNYGKIPVNTRTDENIQGGEICFGAERRPTFTE